MKYAKSKFVFDASTMEVVEGRAPSKDGQLWKGETTTGKKMELAGCTPRNNFYSRDMPPYVAYDGWS